MQNKFLQLELPWPPTINTYWRRNGNRYFITDKGLSYRREVIELCYKHHKHFTAEDRISVLIEAYPPDKRKRDLDNILKSLLDSLCHAGIYTDDSQIDRLHIWRQGALEGRIIVSLFANPLEELVHHS